MIPSPFHPIDPSLYTPCHIIYHIRKPTTQFTKSYPLKWIKQLPIFLTILFEFVYYLFLHFPHCFYPEKFSMSAIQIASASKFRYQKLSDDERERVILRPKNWYRFRRIPIRRRFRLKVPSLRKLWRKQSRLISAMKISFAKVMKRFKDDQVHFGDLFAGNYLFMQVNPASLKYLQNEFTLSKFA